LPFALPYTPSAWNNFFSAEVGASAALTGLLFVAVSINLARIVANRQLIARSAKALTMLSALLLAATLCLAPGVSVRALGVALCALGVLNWLAVSFCHFRASWRNPYVSATQQVAQTLLSQLAVLPLIAGGASLLALRGGGLYWLVAMALVSLFAALLDAWVLLIEIHR
jgi:modulator of FtsH protease